MEQAVAVSRGTVAGHLIEADLRLWDGNTAAAQAALQAAVKLDAGSLEAQDALAEFYARTGQLDAAEDQQAIARALVQTTAAPMLRQAWRRTEKTAWQGAAGFLTRARQLDPTDPRVPAYLAVTLEGQGQASAATAAYRAAIALEDARIRLDEPSTRQGAPLTREPLDFGTALRARLRLAAALERANQPVPAADLYLANAALASRVDRADYSRQMFTSMLPGDAPTGGAVVASPRNIATWLAESSLAAAKALRALGRNQEADAQLRIAASFSPAPGTMVPRIGNAQGDTNFSNQATSGSGEAMVELAKQFLEAGNTTEAMKYLQAATNAGIPDRLRAEVNQMNLALARMMSNQRAQPQPSPQQDRNEPPERQRLRDMQEQQENERNRRAAEVMAARARVTPDLVGTWTVVPENQFLPTSFTLTIDGAANFSQVFPREGRTVRGKASLQARGVLMLIGEDGRLDTLYFESTGQNTMDVQMLEGARYRATKR